MRLRSRYLERELLSLWETQLKPMTYYLHPINSFGAGFLLKHAAIIVPLSIPPVIIFFTKGDAMLSGDPQALLFLIPAIISLIIPHIFIRNMHQKLKKDIPSIGTMSVSSEEITWKASDKTTKLNRAEISNIDVEEKLLHRFAFGKTGFAFLKINIITKSGKQHRFLVSNEPVDRGKDFIRAMGNVYG